MQKSPFKLFFINIEKNVICATTLPHDLPAVEKSFLKNV